MSTKLEIAQTAHLDNLLILHDFVEQACQKTGVDDPARFALKLAVDEICANIVTHGYADQEPGPITLTFHRDEQQVVVTIRDQGQPFDPNQTPSPKLNADWHERCSGGLGLYLVHQMVDQVTYQSDPDSGNCLTLIKSLDQPIPKAA